jgi:DNA-binding MarR family transcriptional regulator
VPRLDSERVALLRSLTAATTAVTRQIDAELTADFALPLAWFEVMTALHAAGGSLRVNELRAALDEVPSSLSRRLDRMEADGYVARESPGGDDRRAVVVTLTATGGPCVGTRTSPTGAPSNGTSTASSPIRTSSPCRGSSPSSAATADPQSRPAYIASISAA